MEKPAQEVLKTVTFRVFRFNPEKDKKPHFDTFQVPVIRGMTILDGLMYIKENLDNTLSYRKSCRMGVCGSCGMFVNGFPELSCQVQILHLNADVLEIRPLPNYPTIRDLVADYTPMFEKHEAIKPYVIRGDEKELFDPSGEFAQSPEELEAYLQFSYCLKCGLCLAACPTVSTDDKFLGPQALAQAYRYIIDNRDDGYRERLEVLDTPHGPWRCHFPGACSEACPKGVDPAFAIQLLKREIVARKLRLRKPHRVAQLAPKPEKAEPRPGIPKAPEPTVAKAAP